MMYDKTYKIGTIEKFSYTRPCIFTVIVVMCYLPSKHLNVVLEAIISHLYFMLTTMIPWYITELTW